MNVGILGNGQLAQLLGHAAYPLGVTTVTHETGQPFAPFIQEADVLTFEHEHVDLAWLAAQNIQVPIYPDPQALQCAQDRWEEKSAFAALGLPTVAFADVKQVPDDFAFPALLKTRRHGYDGKGQARVKHYEAMLKVLNEWGHQEAIVEAWCDFDEEVSLIIARDRTGEVVTYPLVRNEHASGILRTSYFPYEAPELQSQADVIGRQWVEHMDYVGVCAIEFFVVDGQLLLNEWAPRVHNSGHITIEACDVSQFENHLRAITGMPLVAPTVRCHATMENIIGEWPADSTAGDCEHVYCYHKTPRPGRKLGHRVKWGSAQ